MKVDLSERECAAWFLLQCKPRQEERAKENLDRQGYTCFYPTMQVERIRRGKRATSVEPLFPCYVFVSLDLVNDNWSSIRSTRGVIRIVSFNGDPATVPNTVIDSLRQHDCLEGQPDQVLKPGDGLKITSGPFRELEVIFQSYDGEERVFVLLNMLQKQQKLSVPIRELEAV